MTRLLTGTPMGKVFFEHHVPEILKALTRIAEALESMVVEEEAESCSMQWCYKCGKPQAHINDGGTAWTAYRDIEGGESEELLYCNTEECSAEIFSCTNCSIDVLDGHHCPSCKSKITSAAYIINQLKEAHISEEQLDSMVHEVASKTASEINNGGMGEQVEYLLSEGYDPLILLQK